MQVELKKDDIESILLWYDSVENDFGPNCMSEEEIKLRGYLENLINNHES